MEQSVVSAVFDSRDEARRALEALRDAGARDRALSLVARQGEESTGGATGDEPHGSDLLRGILGGGALGAGLGVAALAIPGVGPLAAAGAIAAAAVPGALGIGAAAGAVAGTLNETLAHHGVSAEDTGYYNDRIAQGGVFVSVDTRDAGISPGMAEEILYRHGGHNSRQSRTTAL